MQPNFGISLLVQGREKILCILSSLQKKLDISYSYSNLKSG